jgi:hypothetical protein
VAHVPRRNDEDDVLGDVGCVIRDPFEMPGDKYEVQRSLDCPGVVELVAQEITKDLHFQVVQRFFAVRVVFGAPLRLTGTDYEALAMQVEAAVRALVALQGAGVARQLGAAA